MLAKFLSDMVLGARIILFSDRELHWERLQE